VKFRYYLNKPRSTWTAQDSARFSTADSG